MKRLLFIFFTALFLSGTTSSCKKAIAKLFPGVDVAVPDMQMTLPAIIFVSPSEIPLGTFSFQFNLDSVVRAQTAGVFNANDVTSIKVKQITITITNADQLNNFANFERARVMLQSNSNNTPVEIFSATFPDAFASSFTTTNNNTELLSYLKGTDLVYTMYGKNRRITTKPLDITISVIVRAN